MSDDQNYDWDLEEEVSIDEAVDTFKSSAAAIIEQYKTVNTITFIDDELEPLVSKLLEVLAADYAFKQIDHNRCLEVISILDQYYFSLAKNEVQVVKNAAVSINRVQELLPKLDIVPIAIILGMYLSSKYGELYLKVKSDLVESFKRSRLR